jgi:hypothetical protein
VRHAVGDARAEAEHRVRIRRRDDQRVDGHRRAQLLGDGLDQGLCRQLLVRERIDSSHRLREVAGGAR